MQDAPVQPDKPEKNKPNDIFSDHLKKDE